MSARSPSNTPGLQKGQNGDWKAEGIRMEHESSHSPFGKIPRLTVSAIHPKSGVVGHAEFEQVGNNWEPQSTNVVPEHQRKGIASGMYEHAEKMTHMKITPSASQTSEGKKIWSQQNRSFGKMDAGKSYNDLKKAQLHKSATLDGKVLGQTPSGKVVYDSPLHSEHADFDASDHEHAAQLHNQAAVALSTKAKEMHTIGGTPFNPKKLAYTQASEEHMNHFFHHSQMAGMKKTAVPIGMSYRDLKKSELLSSKK